MSSASGQYLSGEFNLPLLSQVHPGAHSTPTNPEPAAAAAAPYMQSVYPPSYLNIQNWDTSPVPSSVAAPVDRHLNNIEHQMHSVTTDGQYDPSRQPAFDRRSNMQLPDNGVASEAASLEKTLRDLTAVLGNIPQLSKPAQPEVPIPDVFSPNPPRSRRDDYDDNLFGHHQQLNDSFHRGSRRHSGRDKFPADVRCWTQRYDGTQDLDAYLSQLELVGHMRGWTDHDLGIALVQNLKGKATMALKTLSGPPTYAALVQRLRTVFEPHAHANSYKTQLFTRTRQTGETNQDFALALSDLASKAFPELDAHGRDAMALHAFQSGQPTWLRVILASADLRSMGDAVSAALRIESAHKGRLQQAPTQPPQLPAVAATVHYPQYHDDAYQGYTLPVVPEHDDPFVESDYAIPLEYDNPNPSGDGQTRDHIDEGSVDMLREAVTLITGVDLPGVAECHAASGGQQSASTCHYCGKPGHYWFRCWSVLELIRQRRIARGETVPPVSTSTGFQGSRPRGPRPQQQRPWVPRPPGQRTFAPRTPAKGWSQPGRHPRPSASR